MSLGDAVANEPGPLHESSGSIAAFELSALSEAMTHSAFDSNSLSMGSSFGDQYDDPSFTSNSTEVDWSMLEGYNGLHAPENTPSDFWFNSTTSSLHQDGQTNTNPAFNYSSFRSDPSPNSGTQELYLPDVYSSLGSLLQPDIFSVGSIDPTPSAPLPETAVPDIASPLASISAQECSPHLPSTPIQAPANLLLGLLDGKRCDGKSQGNPGEERRGAIKRKANSASQGMADSGASKPKRKRMKNTGETAGQEMAEAMAEETEAGQEMAEATMEETEADRLAKEAEAAQQVAAKAAQAAQAAQAAAKAAKEKTEVARPEHARRSGHVSTLPGRFKQGGYTAPKRGSRGKKSS